MTKPFNLERAIAGDQVQTRDGQPVPYEQSRAYWVSVWAGQRGGREMSEFTGFCDEAIAELARIRTAMRAHPDSDLVSLAETLAGYGDEIERLREELRQQEGVFETLKASVATVIRSSDGRASAERDELQSRLRETAQILIAVVGADGPTNAEDVAVKAVGLIDELRAQLDNPVRTGVCETCVEASVLKCDELRALVEVRGKGCQCGDDEACAFVRERDELRAALEWAVMWIERTGDSSDFAPLRDDSDSAQYAAARKVLGWDK